MQVSVGEIFTDKPYQDLDFSLTETNAVRCPDFGIKMKKNGKLH
jgi:chorismate synthase